MLRVALLRYVGFTCCTVFFSSGPEYGIYKLAVSMRLAI